MLKACQAPFGQPQSVRPVSFESKLRSDRMQAVTRPLLLSKRMIALAAAMSIDYDYFSRHSPGDG